MIFKRFSYTMILFIIFLSACSVPPEKTQIIVSGSVGLESITDSYDQPIFVFVAKGDDMDLIEEEPMEYLITVVSVDLLTYKFRIDLTDKDVQPGDEISIFAFIDKDFAKGMPYPSLYDIAGFFVDEDRMSGTIVLEAGENDGVDIELNRIVYSFDANVQGSVNENYEGALTIVAYAGEMTSSNTSDMDYDGVIGFEFIEKGEEFVDFDMTILPYGYNVPIENVYLFALLDVNRNGKTDAGDKIGYYMSDDADYPTSVTINEGTQSGFEIEFAMDVMEPSGYNMSLKGNMILPEAANNVSAPTFIIVVETDNPEDLTEDPASVLKYFEKVPAGQTSFDIDITDTDLTPDDEIMILALWDKDNKGGFPEPTLEDYIGFYMDTEDLSMTYILKNGVNDGIEIDISREVFSFDAKINGTVTGSETGEIILIAYAGEITSMDMDNAMDYDKVIAYREYTKNSSTLDFTLKVLQYGQDVPIENVSVFAILDKNKNGTPDSGDIIGYHTSGSDDMPELITVNEGVINNVDVKLLMELATPSGYEMSLSGKLEFSESNDSPVYIIVASSDDPSLMMDDLTSSIKYFEKIPKGATEYNIKLSSTDLVPGDEVMVVSLQDIDSKGGFPNPTDEDFIGLYIDTEALEMAYVLKNGENTGVDIGVKREVFSFDAELKGTINGNETGEMLVIAYAGELNSLDFDELDYDKVVGYQEYTKTSEPLSYSMDIFPYGVNVPIENLYVFAFLDKNGNGTPDGGDILGYPINPEDNMPELVTVTEGVQTGIDIEMSYAIPEPSGYTMSLSGYFEKPDGYDESSSPVFILVTTADDLEGIFDDPLSTIKVFEKLPAGENSFDIDLSNTDLVPGDEVIISAMWDKDFKGGFPNPSAGDYIGLYINPEEFLMSITLMEGLNTVDPDGEYDFKVNRKFYDHDCSVSFKFHDGDLPNRLDDDGDGNNLDIGDSIIIVLFQKMGLNNGRLITNSDMDMDIDYLLGMETVTVNSENSYSVNLLPVLFDGISVNDFIDDVYILAILDENENGVPDEGEYIGYYWRSWWDTLFLYQPATVDLSDGKNTLNRSVRFANFKF